jgi:hypothetical protein
LLARALRANCLITQTSPQSASRWFCLCHRTCRSRTHTEPESPASMVAWLPHLQARRTRPRSQRGTVNRRLFMLNFSASAIAFYGSTIAIFSLLTALSLSSFALLAPICEVARISPCLAPSPPQAAGARPPHTDLSLHPSMIWSGAADSGASRLD